MKTPATVSIVDLQYKAFLTLFTLPGELIHAELTSLLYVNFTHFSAS